MIAAVRRHMPFGKMAGGAYSCVGMQLKGDQIALARVTANEGGVPKVTQLQWLHVEPIRRGEAIRRLAHTGTLTNTRICLTLAPGEYDIYQLPTPNVPEEELREALRWQLRGTLPYPPEDAELDFVRVPPSLSGQESATAAKPSVLLVAAPRATVEHLIAPFSAAGVHVHSVEIPEFSQRNLALLKSLWVNTQSAQTGTVPSCVAWLSFDHDACVLTVQTGVAHPSSSDLCFTRRIHIPNADGSVSHGTIETDHTIQYLIERIVTQVQRSLDLFERQSGQPPVGLLTVGPHRFEALIAQQLADRLALNCQTFDPTTYLHLAEDLPQSGSPIWSDALSALGAALRVEGKTHSHSTGFIQTLKERWINRSLWPHAA